MAIIIVSTEEFLEGVLGIDQVVCGAWTKVAELGGDCITHVQTCNTMSSGRLLRLGARCPYVCTGKRPSYIVRYHDERRGIERLTNGYLSSSMAPSTRQNNPWLEEGDSRYCKSGDFGATSTESMTMQ